MNGRDERRELARAGMAVQTFNILVTVGGIIGGLAGLALPAMLLADTMGQSSPLLWLALVFVGGIAGWLIGQRLVMMLLAR